MDFVCLYEFFFFLTFSLFFIAVFVAIYSCAGRKKYLYYLRCFSVNFDRNITVTA